MDLPTCPSCGQSVLDDDVEECPFCGESMTGKPVAKKKVEPAAKASEPTPSAKKSGAGAKSAKASDEDNPFGDEVEADAGPKAIQASPKKMKGRTHQVVCPMCETAGFVPKKAAGKNVKCANKECLVPVFTAPELELKPDAESQETAKPQNNNMLTYSLLGVFLIGAAIFTFMYLGGDGNGQNVNKKTGPIVDVPKGGPEDNPNGEPGKTEVVVTPKPTGTDYDKLRNRVFVKMEDEAITKAGNRNVPLCRRLMADGYGLLGDNEKRDAQLDRMRDESKNQPSLSFYNIVSKVTEYWQKRAAGDSAGAKASLQAALEFVDTLATPGSEQAEVALALATALAADGQAAEARKILAPHDRDTQAAQLSAFLHICRELELAKHNGPRWGRPPFKWNGSQQVAVTVALVARGLSTVADAWASGASEPAAHADCLIALAEAQALFGATPTLDAVAAKLSSEFKALLYARMALRSQAAQRTALVAKAVDALSTATPPSGLQVVGWQQVLETKVPDSAAYWAILRAAVETARLEADSANRWKIFETARQKLDAMAPSTTDAGVLNNMAREAKSRIQSELVDRNLASRANSSARADLFREQCTNIANSMQAEYNLQGQLLMHAIFLGHRTQVFEILEADLHMLRTVPIAWYALYKPVDAASARRLQDKGAPVKSLSDFEKIEFASRLSPTLVQIEEAKRIMGSELTGDLLALRQIWQYDMLIAACELDDQDIKLDRHGWKEAFRLINRSHDDEKVWREYALELLGIRATRKGHGEAFIELVEEQDNIALKATETASALHGFLVGSTLIPAPKPEPVAPANDGKQSNKTPASVGG